MSDGAEKRVENRSALRIPDAIDLRRPEMALEGCDHDWQWRVDIGRRAVSETRELLRHETLAGRLIRPQPDAGLRQPFPRKQFPRIRLACRRHVGMSDHAVRRNGMARNNAA